MGAPLNYSGGFKMKQKQIFSAMLSILFMAVFCCQALAQQNECEVPGPPPPEKPLVIVNAADGPHEYGNPHASGGAILPIPRVIDEEFLKPTGPATPLWRQLENLEHNDKRNAEIGIEVLSTSSPALRESVCIIEEAWNGGAFGEAILLLRRLEEMSDAPDIAVGINWRIPKPAGSTRSNKGVDVPVGTYEYTIKAVLDYHAGTGNQFVVTKRFDTASGDEAWNVFFSSDGGASWSETYQWMTIGQSIADIDAVVIDQWLYIAYVGDVGGYECRTRRCDTATGLIDNGYFWVTVIDKGVTIEELAIVSTAEIANTRLYLASILADGSLVYFWDDQDGSSWTEVSTGITNAEAGLDLSLNVGYDTNFLWACYVDTNGDIIAASRGGGVWTAVNLGDPGYSPRIAAYEDNVFVVFEHIYINGWGIRYRIQYSGYTGWSIGEIAVPDYGESFHAPDVTGRWGAGFAVVYSEEAGTFDPCWLTRRDYHTPNWTAPISYNDVDVLVGNRNCVEAIPSGSGGISHGVVYQSDMRAPYFDRIDYPEVDIKCNGSDGPLYPSIYDDLTMTVHLDPQSFDGEPSDWWIYAERNAASTWWAKYRSGQKPQWTKSSSPIRFAGATLRTVNSYTVLGPRTLPVGDYVFGFAVDCNKDNWYDAPFVDTVELHVN